jgi:Holliday junction resolvase RusA-like endonuclease
MVLLDILIPGEPVAKGRHRTVRKTGMNYTPKKTLDAEKRIAMACSAQYQGPMLDEPLRLDLTFSMGMPKSWSKKKRAEMDGQPCTKKPDLDNLIKITDGINHSGVWRDDSLVTQIVAEMVWSFVPSTRIIISKVVGA